MAEKVIPMSMNGFCMFGDGHQYCVREDCVCKCHN